jgi:hypothetical protein
MQFASRVSTLRVDAGTSFRWHTPSRTDRTVPLVSPGALNAVIAPRRTFTIHLSRINLIVTILSLIYPISFACSPELITEPHL